MKKRILVFVLLIIILINGCSLFSISSEQSQNEKIDGKEAIANGQEITDNTDDIEYGEAKEYIIPKDVWEIAGMSAEEQLKSYKEENADNNYFKNIEVNDEQALVLTMTEKQKKLYEDKVRLIINENIEEAEKKEDIYIEINENYDEARMVLGEKASSAGFQVAYVKLATQIGIYQILNGCDPEEWGFHLTMEREEEIILDVDVPDDEWVLTNEDFGE